MKRVLAIGTILVAFLYCGGHAQASAGGKKGISHSKHWRAKKGKRKLTAKEARALQRKAEREGKRHEMEMRRREYQQMMDARRRSMIQRQREMQEQGTKKKN